MSTRKQVAYPLSDSGTPHEEITDLDRGLGLVYRRADFGYHTTLRFDRPAIVLPRYASVLEIEHQAGVPAHPLDGYGIMVIPSETKFTLRSRAGEFNAAILIPSSFFLHHVSTAYGIPSTDLSAGLSEVAQAGRGNWLNECLHRFIFERVEVKKSDSVATAFLEEEILKEVHYALRQNRWPLPFLGAADWKVSVLRKALLRIEANLFTRVAGAALARECRVKETELNQIFEELLGKAPQRYIEARRAHEGLVLIKSGKLSIDAIAKLTGFSSSQAFTTAFKAIYGAPPTELKRK